MSTDESKAKDTGLEIKVVGRFTQNVSMDLRFSQFVARRSGIIAVQISASEGVRMLLRSRIPELMDDPRLDRELHVEALRGLEVLNKVSGSAQILWSELNKFSLSKQIEPILEVDGEVNGGTISDTTPEGPASLEGQNDELPASRQSIAKQTIAKRSSRSKAAGEKISVLDVATGSGDILLELAKLSKRNGRQIEFTGADISPTAIAHAEQKAQKAGTPAQFIQRDVIKDGIPKGFQVVMTSLFTHHLDPEEVILLFERMKDSDAQMILINDLVRSELSYSLVWLATRLFTRSPVVHFDGPVSVRASYTPEEMRNMALVAGLENCSVKLHPPCRQLLVWRRS